MKKILVLLVTLFTMMMSGTVFAGEVTKDFAKEHAAVDVIVKSFDSSEVTYANVAANFTEELKAKFTDKEYTALTNTVKQNFGKTKEFKFVSLEHFDKADKLTYLASFSKENLVLATFIFDNTGRKPLLNSITMIPVEVNEKGTLVAKKAEN